MTVSDLIDYLAQFPGDTTVVLSEGDVKSPCEFIVLDVLDFTEASNG